MKKIMHVAEPFATGVLSFLVDLTRQQVEEYEVYILYGVRPLTPDNVSNLFDKRVYLIKIDSFKGAIFIRCTRLSNKLLTLSGVNGRTP